MRHDQSVSSIREILQSADAREIEELELALANDERIGVRKALESAKLRLASQQREHDRVQALYKSQERIAGGALSIGLDEVGRGPLAGPLVVAGVVLPRKPLIDGLNDSKQLSAKKRVEVADRVKQIALAYSIVSVPAHDIDLHGISFCLKHAFRQAIADIEGQGIAAEVVLLDGNPLGIDHREINVVKGDSVCASIAAASVVAKVDRDTYMVELAKEYPEYGFAENKGYGSKRHVEAIRKHGMSPVHRASFCSGILHPTLF